MSLNRKGEQKRTRKRCQTRIIAMSGMHFQIRLVQLMVASTEITARKQVYAVSFKNQTRI